MAAFLDNLGCQRNICCDHEIARLKSLDDFVVGYIEARRDLNRSDKV